MRRWIEIFSWVTGLCLFAIYGAVLTWSSYASNLSLDAMREARANDVAELKQSYGAGRGAAVPTQATLAALPPDTTTWSKARRTAYRDGAIDSVLPSAVLRIPSLKLEVPVYAGTSIVVLNRGAGLIEGTALPGNNGNTGIAAHRDGFFRPLQDIRTGAELYIDTIRSTRRYRVTNISVVAPQDVSVLEDAARPTVTLVTCYPFHFVGAAPQRFVVRAEIVG